MAWKNFLLNRLRKAPKTSARNQQHNSPKRRKRHLHLEQLETREVPATITNVSNVLNYTAGASINNNLSVTISGSNFVFHDTAETITTSISGATGSGTNTVNVPTTSITGITLNLADGADTISASGVVLTTQAMIINHSGTGLTITGPLTTTTGSITVNNTGTGDITEAGNITSTSGSVSVSSNNNYTLNAKINAGSGTITLKADQGSAGTGSFTQNASNTVSTITTTNTTANAVSITVNTSSNGGTGNANIRTIAATSGTLNINAYGGSILYAGTDTLTAGQAALTTLAPDITGPAPSLGGGGSAPTGTVNAKTYILATSPTGSGSIGTAARPINTVTVSGNSVGLAAGSGGAYFVDWYAGTTTLSSASATGAGSVEVVSANAGGHNLVVAGNVTTGSGNIVLAADDDFTVNSGVTIGGAGFSGDVYMACNRDTGNGENLTVSGTITSSNTTASAVVIEGFHTEDNGTNSGVVNVSNITVGNGGTINLSTVPSSAPAGQGTIIVASTSTVLNAGPLGTVNFLATSMNGNTTYTSVVGTSATPIKVTAGNVIVTANVGAGTATVEPASVYVTDTIAGNFTATIGNSVNTAASSYNLTTTAGALTVLNPISNVNNGAINLTGAGGVVLNADVGGGATGAVNINGPLSGTANIDPTTGTVTLTQNADSTFDGSITGSQNLVKAGTGNLTLAGTSSAWMGTTAINGGSLVVTGTETGTSNVTTSGTGLLSGTGTVDAAQISGTFSPGTGPSTTGILTVPNLTLASTATFAADLNGTTAGTSYDQVNVSGAVSLGNANLALNALYLPMGGDSYVLINNAGSNPVSGTFFGLPEGAVFTQGGLQYRITYQGGDGNDVVVTNIASSPNTTLDVLNGAVYFLSGQGVNNALAISQDGTNYTVSDPSGPITLSANAVAAGWMGSGTTTVTGPLAGITVVSVNLSDGTDTITGLDTGPTASLVLSGSGSVNLTGAVTSAGPVTVTGETNVTASSTGSVTGTTLTLNVSNGAGTSTQPLPIAMTAVVAEVGADGLYLAEADGGDLTASATGAGNINVVNVMGTLNVAGPITTVTGNISLSSGDAITLGANLNAGSGTISIAANTDGTGGEGYDQQAATLTTTNTTANALAITVNTASGGTGDAVIGKGNIGSSAGGTITVNSNGGNILWSNDPSYTAFTTSQTGLSNGGSNTQTLRARLYNFTATGAGGIGADPRPLQIDNFGPDSVAATPPTLTASAGDGGIYVVGWDQNGNDLTTGNLAATGAGSIRVVAANAGGHNLWVEGNVSAVSGNIYLAADDNLNVGPGVTIGGIGFSGTVWMSANRDRGTAGQTFTMDPTSAIVTSSLVNNTVPLTNLRTPTDQAVYLDISGDAGTPSTITLGSITAGDGGRIVVNAIPYANLFAPETDAGHLVMAGPANVLNAGPTGTVELVGRISATAVADAIGTAATPIAVTAGTVVTNSNYGNVYVTDSVAASISSTIMINTDGATGQTGAPSLNFTTTAGALTINDVIGNVNGGAINLNGAGGVVLNTDVGGSGTGAIGITGGLSGAGNIDLDSGAVTVTQSVDSSYDGDINGAQALTKAGTGNLTLTNMEAYTGATVISGGVLSVNGTLQGTSGVTTPGGTLAGSGTVNAAVNAQGGTVSPGNGAVAVLNTGNLSFGTGGTLTVNLNGSTAPGTDYDQVNVNGTVNLTNTTLNILVGVSPTLNIGDTYTIINNDLSSAVTGTFANSSFAASDNPRYQFTVSYVGGDGNDVVLTLSNIIPLRQLDVTGGNTIFYTSGVGIDNNITLSTNGTSYTVSDTSGTIALSAAAVAAGWTAPAP